MTEPGRDRNSNAWWLLAVVFALGWGHGLLADIANVGMGDWDYFTSHSLVAHRTWFEYGQAPFWNPYNCGGQTLVGNYQARAFSPSFLLVAATGVQWGNRLYLLLALALGFEGTRRLALRLGAGTWGSLFAAVAVVGNGAILPRIGIGHFGDVPYLFLPWWFLAMLRARHRPLSGALIGGAWGALCLLEAGSYPLIYGALLAVAWMVARSIAERSARPLLGMLAVCAATPLLGLFVVWPSMLHLAQTLRESVEPEVIPPRVLLDAFFSTELLWSYEPRFPGQKWHWWEYGAYVGPVFAAALLLALVRGGHRSWGWFGLGAVFVWYGLGDVHAGAPWTLAHELPVLESLRASGRAFVPAVLCFALATAAAVDRVRFAPWLVVGLAANLAWVVPPVLHGQFPLELEHPAAPPPFVQSDEVEHMRYMQFRNHSLLTQAVLRNQGSLRGYEPAARKRFAANRQGKPEIFLSKGTGRVEVQHWSPNELRIVTDSPGDVLVVNQNWHEDWRADDGREVRAFKGRLSTPVQPGRDEVTLRFVPAGFFPGLAVALLTALLLAVGVYFTERSAPR